MPRRSTTIVGVSKAGFFALAVLFLAVSAVHGDVDLELRVSDEAATIGDMVSLALCVVSDSVEDQPFRAVDLIFSWDTDFLRLLGVDNTGAVSMLFSGLPAIDSYNLNEEVPPQDGDGFYNAMVLGSPAIATPEGTLLTTFQFQALACTLGSEVALEECGGSPVGRSRVFHPVTPNLSILGDLRSATVTIVPEPGVLVVLAFGGLVLLRRR
ncbi:MAG: hypothetical protein KAV82_03730 [Phycisphaerae bacterium]|nr:hypothetical protein [Phycisphaerae bacterium]